MTEVADRPGPSLDRRTWRVSWGQKGAAGVSHVLPSERAFLSSRALGQRHS